jgi:Amt family ammonium transporter
LAGSASTPVRILEANGLASLAFINTFVATAAAAVSWSLVEQVGKPSMLGAASGAVAGLVAITPASGFAAPMTSIVLGLIVSPICFFFVSTVKNKLSMTTRSTCSACTASAVSSAPSAPASLPTSLGGQGWVDYTVFPAKAGTYDMVGQVITQIKAVVLTLVLSGVGSAILFIAPDKTIGLRPSEEAEREGLDITEHGERAYNM